MEGWVKLHRQLTEKDLWKKEPFTRGQAWVDLILLANHKDGFIRVKGIRIDLLRGQLGYSILTLSKRWQWSEGKVKRFINELKTDEQITYQTNNVTTIISITNYETYQENGEQIKKQTANRRRTDGEQTATNKNVNNGNNGNNEKNNTHIHDETVVVLDEYFFIKNDDYKKFVSKYGYTIFESMLARIQNWNAENTKKPLNKNVYLRFNNWAINGQQYKSLISPIDIRTIITPEQYAQQYNTENEEREYSTTPEEVKQVIDKFDDIHKYIIISRDDERLKKEINKLCYERKRANYVTTND